MIIVQAAISGALLGGLFALMAVGLSLTWGVLRVINLAHFALILVGAYVTYELATSVRVDPLLTLAVTVPALFAAGAAIQWVFERFRLSEFNSLLVSYGVLVVAVQAVSNVWSADFRRMPATVNPYATQSVALGPLILPTTTLIAFLFAVVIVVGAHLILERTFPGRALKAFAHDRAIASAFGIDHARLGMLLAGASGATAAIAGMLFALGSALTPSTPFAWIGIVFAVVILGGIGDAIGTLLAGMVVGVVSGVVSVVWSPATAPLVIFSAVIIALVLRPNGVFVRPQRLITRGAR